jgi:hypothetical protein
MELTPQSGPKLVAIYQCGAADAPGVSQFL